MRNFLIIAVFVIVAAIPRLVLLNTYPDGFNIDELDYVLNAKAVYFSHTDISHKWDPLSLTTLPDEQANGELTTIIMAPFLGPMPFSLFNARLPFAIAGIGSVVLIYLITKKLFGHGAGIAAGLISAINPLAIFWSRTTVDTPVSIFFFLLALFALLYGKRWHILLAIIPLFMAFYTYIGSKLIFLPFVFVTVGYCWLVVNKRRFTINYSIVVLVSIIIFISFVIRFSSLPASSRSNTIFSPTHHLVSEEVDAQRRLALVSPLNGLFSNKFVVYAKMATDRYLGAFSPNMLFSTGDSWHFWYLWGHGFFYYIDGLFIVAGVLELIYKRKREAVFFLLLFFSATIPTILNGVSTSYVNRSYLYLILLMITAGIGLNQVFAFVQKNPIRKAVFLSGLACVYVISMSVFFWNYFIRSPVNQQSQYDFPYRVLARYISEEIKDGKQTIVVSSNPRYVFQQFVLFDGPYNQLGNSNVSNKLAERFASKNYSWQGALFTDNCSDLDFPDKKTLIVSETVDCSHHLSEFSESPHLGIQRLSDSGEQFKILQGHSCGNLELNTFANRISFSDLNIEKLSYERFCQQFITGPPLPQKI